MQFVSWLKATPVPGAGAELKTTVQSFRLELKTPPPEDLEELRVIKQLLSLQKEAPPPESSAALLLRIQKAAVPPYIPPGPGNRNPVVSPSRRVNPLIVVLNTHLIGGKELVSGPDRLPSMIVFSGP